MWMCCNAPVPIVKACVFSQVTIVCKLKQIEVRPPFDENVHTVKHFKLVQLADESSAAAFKNLVDST